LTTSESVWASSLNKLEDLRLREETPQRGREDEQNGMRENEQKAKLSDDKLVMKRIT